MARFGEPSSVSVGMLKNSEYGLKALKDLIDVTDGVVDDVLVALAVADALIDAIKTVTDALPVAPSDESGSFTWDTSEYTTDETDISALFTTPLTGTTRRRLSVFLDLSGPAGDSAAWTTCTVNVKVKIDGSNYRTVDQSEIAKADVAAAKEPGVPIDIPSAAQDVQITLTFDVALDDDQTIYYHTVIEPLE